MSPFRCLGVKRADCTIIDLSQRVRPYSGPDGIILGKKKMIDIIRTIIMT